MKDQDVLAKGMMLAVGFSRPSFTTSGNIASTPPSMKAAPQSSQTQGRSNTTSSFFGGILRTRADSAALSVLMRGL
ncbi:MAG: hypothetical protein VR75_03725 [Hyphomonadaceae bacterium BRH_c29]|nr:MAG: hypothetical protein VR75_03725 [Hyphomonadaceae bacterium BRH_c29]HAY05802.1 hypothetical protein [Hyphomonas sp.]